MRTLIVDDVKLSRDGLAVLLGETFPEAEILNSVGSVADARKLLNSEVYDIVFLDIQLKDGIGFDLLDDIPAQTKVVFITAYENYAIEAIRNGAFDYLLKPINVEELNNCIQRIRNITEIQAQITSDASTQIYQDKIGISSLDGIDYVDVDDIIYLKADGKYTEIITRNGKLVSSKNLKMFSYILNERLFVRVHNSYIVNISLISRFKKDDGMLILKDGTSISVSKSRKDFLLKRLVHI
jgi:two-component system LytT family response regulator